MNSVAKTSPALEKLFNSEVKPSEADRLKAFEEIYDAYNGYVRKTLFWLVSHERVDDLVQESFVRIWQNLDQFKGQSSLKTWIYRVTMNLAYDHLRKDKKWYQLSQQSEHQIAPPTEPEYPLQELIKLGIATLPVKQRLVFVLFYQQELSVEEISEALKIRQGTVKSRLFHGRKVFIDYLKDNGVQL